VDISRGDGGGREVAAVFEVTGEPTTHCAGADAEVVMVLGRQQEQSSNAARWAAEKLELRIAAYDTTTPTTSIDSTPSHPGSARYVAAVMNA
jgi:hypothetical protein